MGISGRWNEFESGEVVPIEISAVNVKSTIVGYTRAWRREKVLANFARLMGLLALCLVFLGPGLALADVETKPLSDVVQPPEGWTRVDVEEGSFAAFLRTLPIRQDRTWVKAFDGERLKSPSAHIVNFDVGTRDLQQCADSVIRLHAEWLWEQKKPEWLKYHFTSGDLTTWQAWARGERYKVKGSKVERVMSGANDSSRKNFRRWLNTVFMYAGTQSLHRDSIKPEPKDVQIGDFYNQPGGPGHVVIVLDIAVKDGKKMAILGQGFMPAQEFHVIKASNAIDGVWFELPESADEQLVTPSWGPFKGSQLLRFKNL